MIQLRNIPDCKDKFELNGAEFGHLLNTLRAV
jgi:hypothetical protein